MLTTEGHLLGGRVRYRQPAVGFRSGIEPVLLAASVPARPGDHILEAGTGAGAALLCLAARVPNISATGVEAEPAIAELAMANAAENSFASFEVITGDLEAVSLKRQYDHAIANPPYHPSEGSPSPHFARELAKRGSNMLIRGWIERLSVSLRRRGSLTIIITAGMVPLCLEAMTRYHCPCTALFPLWPMAGRPAKLVLLRGMKESRTPIRVMPGLVLHHPDGAFTDTAQTILVGAAPLPLDAIPF